MAWVFGILGALVLFGVLIVRKYRRLYSAAHVQELSRVLGRIKDEALANVDVEPAMPADGGLPPGAGRTSLGLVLVYTVSREDDGGFAHHVSLSKPQSYLATHALETFAALIAELLGVDQIEAGISESRVLHLGFGLEEIAHHAFAAEGVPELSEDEAKALIRHVLAQVRPR